MQQSPPRPQTTSPITQPKAFRRNVGAHSIIAQLVLADVIGALIWTLLGALIWPPTWWLPHALLHLLHASLIFDIGLVVILACLGIGLFRQRVLQQQKEDAWGTTGPIIFLVAAALLILWLIRSDLMTIPARIVPSIPLEAPSWRLILLPQGAAIAVSLVVLAHLTVLWRASITPDTQQLTLSRAHLDGPIWQLIEQAYALYRSRLARFRPPPIRHLKTPSTFYHYQQHTNIPANPEREMYWRNGNLIINRSYIGPKEEQASILLPFLARLLYDCNTADRAVEDLFDLAHTARQTWLTAWPLALPLLAQHRCEGRWRTQEQDRVLDRDWFAYVCGQGPRLRRWLLLQLQGRMQNNQPDNTVPTLAERIDHLDSLLIQEEQQVQWLRNSLPAVPPHTA